MTSLRDASTQIFMRQMKQAKKTFARRSGQPKTAVDRQWKRMTNEQKMTFLDVPQPSAPRLSQLYSMQDPIDAIYDPATVVAELKDDEEAFRTRPVPLLGWEGDPVFPSGAQAVDVARELFRRRANVRESKRRPRVKKAILEQYFRNQFAPCPPSMDIFDCMQAKKPCKPNEDLAKCRKRLRANATAGYRRYVDRGMQSAVSRKGRASPFKGVKRGPRVPIDEERFGDFANSVMGCDYPNESLLDCWTRIKGCKPEESDQKCASRLRKNALAQYRREMKKRERILQGSSLIGGCMMSREEILDTLAGL